jgi:hypothetical protein
MTSTYGYIINGIRLGITCGDKYLDGILIPEDSFDCDPNAIASAITEAKQIYPYLYAYQTVEHYWHCYGKEEFARNGNLREEHAEDIEFVYSFIQETTDVFNVNQRAAIEEWYDFVLNQGWWHYLRQGTANTKKRKPAKDTTGFVYLLQSPTSAYKIGRSKNPDHRLKTFGIQLPYEVEYLAVIPTDDMYTLESELHERYADKRVNGEWFELDDNDVEYIKSLAEVA